MKYSEFTPGQIEAFINKFGGEQDVLDFLSNKIEILKKRALETFKKSQFFVQDSNGVTNLWLSDNFNLFLKRSEEELNIVDVPPYQTLSEPLNCFDIRKKYVESIIKTPKQILQEMRAVITSNDKTFVNGYTNIWYYLDARGKRRYVYCFWSADRAKWNCNENAGYTNTWNAGHRVFAPEA